MSAIDDTSDGPAPTFKALFTLHPGFDTLDFTGPLEVLSHALHNPKDASSKAFQCRFVSDSEYTVSAQGAAFRAHMDYEDAHADLADYDVLIVPGGGSEPLLRAYEKDPETEPHSLIKAFTVLQEKDPSKERTIMSVCTGSLFLAQAGVLQGMAATTHPDYYTKLEILCQEAARKGDYEQTDVKEERYVVNNARFDLGEDEDENPFILRAPPKIDLPSSPNTAHGRRKSIARKGSNAWKESKRRESIIRRQTLRLGGMRLITAGGVTSGMDAALYLVAAMVSHDSALEVARIMCFNWEKGVTVEGIDV